MKKIWRLLFISCFLLINQATVFGQKEIRKAKPFDTYGNVNSEDVMARLDNFAIQLQNEIGTTGYLVCYGPEGDASGTGNYVLRVQQEYLVNSRGIVAERLQTIYGGRYKTPLEAVTELWVLPQGAPPPEPKRYQSKVDTVAGKFWEGVAWDGWAEGADGPSLGNVRLAALADALRQQPKTLAYIVAFNLRGAPPGTWRRVARRDADDLQKYGIQADRVKIIYGGMVKGDKNDDLRSAKLQLWILPGDAPPPVKEAPPERTPKETMQIGSYGDYMLKYPDEERRIFDGFADVLRTNERLSVCLIVRPRSEGGEQTVLEDEPPDVDMLKLVEKWKSELLGKVGIRENRIVVIQAAPDEVNEGTLEVWVVPPGAPLPDPYVSPDDES